MGMCSWPTLIALLLSAYATADSLSPSITSKNASRVHGIKTPLDFKHYVDELHKETNPCTGRFVMLHSSWCPHCHTFQPVWSSVATRLGCPANDRISFGEFECVQSDHDRRTPLKSWPGGLPTIVTQQLEDPSEVQPRDLCRVLVQDAYPTLLLVTQKGCILKGPWEEFNSTPGGPGWADYLGADFEMYHFAVENPAVAGDSIVRALERADLATDCDAKSELKDANPKLLTYLHTVRSTGYPPPTNVTIESRWDDRALTFSPDQRYHDAIIGAYHILGSWIFEEGPTLKEQQFTALLNFALTLAVSLPAKSDRQMLSELVIFLWDVGVSRLTQGWFNNYIHANLTMSGVPFPNAPEEANKYAKLCNTSSCTVWSLFHVLGSLQVLYEQHYPDIIPERMLCWERFGGSFEKDSDLIQSLRRGIAHESAGCISGVDLAQTMHDIVLQFFNCQDCRSHFHKGFTACAADRCTWLLPKSMELHKALKRQAFGIDPPKHALTSRYGFVLWLWRFHNIVNVRTTTDRIFNALVRQLSAIGDSAVDGLNIPFYGEDVRLPSKAQCVQCRALVKPENVMDELWMLHFVQVGRNEAKMKYDHYKDFNLIAVEAYLQAYYVKPAWLGSKPKSDSAAGTVMRIGYAERMEWDPASKSFKVSSVESWGGEAIGANSSNISRSDDAEMEEVRLFEGKPELYGAEKPVPLMYGLRNRQGESSFNVYGESNIARSRFSWSLLSFNPRQNSADGFWVIGRACSVASIAIILILVGLLHRYLRRSNFPSKPTNQSRPLEVATAVSTRISQRRNGPGIPPRAPPLELPI